MKAPLTYIGITQKFVKSGKDKHLGIDMGWNSKYGGYNVPVMSADSGTVHSITFQKTGGWVVWIYHPQYDVATEYGHLRANSICVKVGDEVGKGQKIAMMGNSGKEYDSVKKEWVQVPYHLHFGMQKGKGNKYGVLAKWLNPLKYINVYDNQTISKKDIDKIKHTKKAHDIPSEPLRIRYKSKYGKIVGNIYNGDQVETYGKDLEGWNIVDNLNDYVCSNKYLD